MPAGVRPVQRLSVALQGDLRSLYKDMAKAKGLTARTMKEIGAQHAEPKIDLDISSLNKKYAQVEARLEEISAAKAEASADLDTTRFDVEARALEAKKALLARNIDIVANVDTSQLGTLRQELAKVDKEAGQSKLASWTSQLGRIRIQAGPTSLSVKQLGLALGALGPIITNLVGATVALAGSLGEALVGGATVAAGALAGFGAAATGALLAIKPVFTQLKGVSTAQTAYNTAVAQYGKNSKEARDAQAKLQQTIKGLPPEVEKLNGAWQKLKATFISRTSDIRSSFIEDGLNAIKSARSLLPTFTSQSTKAFSAFSKGWDKWMSGLRTPEAQHLLSDIMTNFRRSIPPLMDAIGNLATALARVSTVGSSFLPNLIRDFDQWTQGIADSTKDTAALHDGIARMVDQFKSWIALIHAAGNVLTDVLGGGAEAGKGMVDTLTAILNRWDDFLNTRKGQSDMSNFFHDSVQTTEHLFSTLSRLVDIFYNLSRGFQPFADGLLLAAKFFGDIGAFVSGWKPLYQIIKATGAVMGAVFIASKIQGMIDLVSALALRWGLVKTAASEAAVAEEVASVAGAGGAAGTATKAAEGATAGGLAARLGLGGASAGTLGLAAAGAATAGLGIAGTVKDIGSLGDAAKKVAAYTVLGPGAFIARGLRELPLFGDAIGGVEDKVSSLAHHVPVVGDAFDTVFGSGADSATSRVHDLVHALNQAGKRSDQVGKTLKKSGVDMSGTVGDAFSKLTDKYGTLTQAGIFMSRKQRTAFLDLARQAHSTGEISDHWFTHIKKVIGGTIQSLGHDIPGFDKNIRGMGDVVHNLGSKTVPQAVKIMKGQFGSLLTAGTQMSKGERAAFKAVAQAAADQGIITRKQLAKIDDAMTNSQQKWNDNARKIAKVTGEKWQDVAKNTQGMTTTVSKDYSNMVEITGKGLDLLTSNTNQALKSVGINKEINFKATHAGGAMAGQVGHPQRRGGITTVPGRAMGDRFPVQATVESGEGLAVINRKAMPYVEWLNRTFPRESPQRLRRGGEARGGGATAGGGGLAFALGPYSVPPIQYASDHAGSNSHVHISAVSIPWLIDIGHKIQQMGNSVGEFQPTSAGNPYHFGPVTTSAHAHYQYDHYSGHAVDVNSLSGSEDRNWVAGIAHVLSTGTSAEIANLKRVILKASQPGTALQAVGQAHLDRYWKAAKDYLAKHMPSATVGSELSGSGDVEKLFARAAEQLATSSTAALALGEAGFAESGMRDLSGGDSTSSGALQLLSSTAASSGLDPHDELAVASSFLTNGYGTGHGANYYAAQGLSPQMVAQSVQRSAFSSGSNYAAQEGPARAWMRRYHLGHGKHYRGGGFLMPEYGGSFANGGVVPGPRGAPRTIIAHGGETINNGMSVRVHVHGDITPKRGYEEDPVEVLLGDERFYDAVQTEVDGSLRLGSELGRNR